MDTRFWGPSGWRLLHLVSFSVADIGVEKATKFFLLLPYVLPCKFCRASLTDYYTADPIPSKVAEFPQWLYRIHNRVNGKLRDQKLLEAADPSWSEIEKRYKSWIEAPCTKRRMVGWDFLFSVAFTTPCPSVTTAPMIGAPPSSALKTPALRNRWSVISRDERLPFIAAWWRLLPDVLPFKEWRAAWRSAVPAAPSLRRGRKAITAWLYAAEKTICATLKEETPHDSFSGLCSELAVFSSNCGKRNKRTHTCRAVKSHARRTLRSRGAR